MTTDRIVENAHAMKERYGFKDFKLKGGVLNGWEAVSYTHLDVYKRQVLLSVKIETSNLT